MSEDENIPLSESSILEIINSVVNQFWPLAVYEIDFSSKITNVSVFRTRLFRKRWHERGENRNMILFQIGTELLTIISENHKKNIFVSLH